MALSKMAMGKNGLDMLKAREGFSPVAYQDTGDVLTIGYGHRILPGEYFPKPITRELAEELLKSDLYKAEQALVRYVKVPLTQNQFDALTSFIFNVGTGAFSRSTLLVKLNEKKYNEVGDQLLRWKYDNGMIIPGLLARREIEKALFYA